MAGLQLVSQSPQGSTRTKAPKVIKQSAQPTTRHPPTRPNRKTNPATGTPTGTDPFGNDYDPAAPLQGDDLHKILTSMVKLKFGDQSAALHTERKNFPSWFQNYRNELAASRDATATNYNNAANAMQGQADSALNVPLGGVSTDPAAQARATAAAAINQAGSADFASLLRTEGANSTGRYNELSSIADGSQLQTKLALRDAARNLKGEKGAFKVTELADLIDKERTYGLQRKAFNLSKYNAQADAGSQALQDQIDLLKARAGITSGKAAADAKKVDTDGDGVPDYLDPAPSTPGDTKPGQYSGGGKGSGGLTPAEARARRTKSSGVQTKLENAFDAATEIKSQYPNATTDQLRALVATALEHGEYGTSNTTTDLAGNQHTSFKGKPVDSYLVKAALDHIINKDGHIGRAHRKGLRQHGMMKKALKPYRPRPGSKAIDHPHTDANS